MLVLIVYDIPDNKRRTKLSNFLEGYGKRVQFSVFECFLSLAEMRELYEKVKKKVKPEFGSSTYCTAVLHISGTHPVVGN
jgi:CRISPR-associated protein Cas2